MKHTHLLLSATLCILTTGISLQSCTQQGQKPQAKVMTSETDTTVYLKPDLKSSPTCRIHIKYMYLQPASPEDSLSTLINNRIQGEIFGEKYISTPSEHLADHIVKDYIYSYKTDVEKLYEADIHNGMKEEDVPGWYNYEYDIKTDMETGKDSIWNYTVTNFQYTGGAHPNTYSKWINIDKTTGKILTADEVFPKESNKEICSLILKALLKEVNSRMETDTIRSIEGLQSIGILLDTDLYIPENFLLEKDGVSFLYNRYEIAPYSTGDFKLNIAYSDIETYLNK